jgi:hypothetical protein
VADKYHRPPGKSMRPVVVSQFENHKAMIALHYMAYNFARIHKTLRVTPAMEAGLADHVWSLDEIARLTG